VSGTGAEGRRIVPYPFGYTSERGGCQYCSRSGRKWQKGGLLGDKIKKCTEFVGFGREKAQFDGVEKKTGK
jgi:hypothetical protein